MAKEIPLTKGYVAIVDDEDYDFLMQWKWQVSCYRQYVYATHSRFNKKGLNMHGIILEKIIGRPLIKGEMTDHIDGDTLNNRRNNLRLATNTQNQWNGKTPKTNTSGYKGVHRYKKTDKWASYMRQNGKKVFIGIFDTPEEAAIAYNRAIIMRSGEYARLNEVK